MKLATKIIWTLSFLIYLILLGLVVYYYKALPVEIPSHFNLKGEIDNYLPKNFIWVLVAIAFVETIVIYMIAKYIKHLNLEISTNLQEKKNKLYLSIASLIANLVFFLIVLFIFQNSNTLTI